jgi:hypothetical protein
MSEEKKEFVVKDRRIFSGDDKDTDQKKTAEKPPGGKTNESDQGKAGEQASEKVQTDKLAGKDASDKKPDDETQLPEINFVTFVLSLNASALVNLGMVEDPASHTKIKNLALAKQTIDILGMLEEKTRGNLSADEENLINHILYELRLIFVKEKK